MAEEKIELRKIRDFGENLSDTFLFIRTNIKPLLGSFFALCGVFMLGQAIFNGIYQSRSFGIFDQIRMRRNSVAGNPFMNIFTTEYFLAILFAWLAHVAMKVAIASYIKYYVENDGQKPNLEQVWTIFKMNVFRVMIYSIIILLIFIVGFVLCLIPGIYLAVVLLPFDYIIVIENVGFSQAINRCFTIIKQNFWPSFGVYIVAGLIYSFSSGIISVLIGIVVGIGTFFSTKSIGTTAGVVTSFLNIFSAFFYIIFLVAAAFQYFTLAEKTDGTGILKRLQYLGEQSTNLDNSEEQY